MIAKKDPLLALPQDVKDAVEAFNKGTAVTFQRKCLCSKGLV